MIVLLEKIKPAVYKLVRHHRTCQQKKQAVTYASLYVGVPKGPMQFMSMDLNGEFHAKSPVVNIYTLTVICMSTG